MTISIRTAIALAALTSVAAPAAAQFNCLYFAAPEDHAIDAHLHSVDVGDLNGDAIADVVVSALDRGVYILYGLGADQYLPPVREVAIAGAAWTSIADFTGDAIPDIAIAIQNPNRVRILPGNGDGTFQPHFEIALDPTHGQVTSLAVADYNGDGVTDMFVGRGFAQESLVRPEFLLSDGAGGFTIKQISNIFGDPFYATSIDIDADGDMDVITATIDSVVIIYHIANSFIFATDLLFPADQEAFGEIGSPGPTSVAAADFDLDGDIDLAVTNVVGSISIFENNNGGFTETHILETSHAGWHIQTADLDADGRSDLILSNPIGDARLQILQNISGADIAFTTPLGVVNDGFPRMTTILELDQFPGLDVVYPDLDRGRVRVVSSAPPAAAQCVYDLTSDGVVDGHDLSVVIAFWGYHGTPADLTQDHMVSAVDIATLLSNWGATTNERAMSAQLDWGYGQRASRNNIQNIALASGADANDDGQLTPRELARWIASR